MTLDLVLKFSLDFGDTGTIQEYKKRICYIH